MELVLRPESTARQTENGGATVSPPVAKRWLPANFRLSINGLETATSRVTHIESLRIKQNFEYTNSGVLMPSTLEIPDLVVKVPESQAESIFAWEQDFIVNGNNSDDFEKSGTLEFLASNLREVYFTLNFSNLGIYRVTADKVESASNAIRYIEAAMYCENMSFVVGSNPT